MKKFGLILSCCAALSSFAVGCSDDPNPVVTDSGVDAGPSTDTGATDSGTPTDTGPAADTGMSACYTEMGTAALCPMRATQGNAMTPSYRLQYINITTPAPLANPVLLNIVNGTFQAGTFLWGLSLDLGANTFRTGALNPTATMRGTVGRGLLDGRFAYYNGNAPTTGGSMANRYDAITGSITVASDRFTTAMSTSTVNIPIFSDDTATSIVTTLPLSNLRISNAQLTANRGCIGLGRLVSGSFDECRSPWNTTDSASMTAYATLDADITVADARNVEIASLQTTLFRYITGLADNNADPMTAAEGRRPTSTANGMPAFHLTATFAAVAANIPTN